MADELELFNVEESLARVRAARDSEAADNFEREVDTDGGVVGAAVGATWGWTKRLPRNIGMGAFRAVLNTVETVDNAFETGGDFIANKVFDPGEPHEPDIETVPPLQTIFPGVFEAAHEFANSVEANNTVADDITQGIAQFAIPFTGWLKALGGVQAGATMLNLGKLGLAEGVTAASAFEAHEGRMADLIEMGRQMDNKFGEVLTKVSPDGSLANTYINWMTDRENEGEWEGRFKNAVDSVVTTAGLGAFLKGAATSLRAGKQIIGEVGTLTPKQLQRGSVSVGQTTPASRVVEYEAHEGTGEHIVRIPGVGEVTAQEGDTAAGGLFMNVKRADVVAAQRGTGAGIQMYERLVEEAHRQNIEFWSDVMVSPDAVRMYEALERRGYKVERNPATVNPNTGSLVSDKPNVPVFKVLPKETE